MTYEAHKTNLIPPHGGYRKLLSFQTATLVYDLTVEFCNKYMTYQTNKSYRTYDQMVQAARSGRQNIAEGSKASGTSKKTELKLVNVARASLEELLLDYQTYLTESENAANCLITLIHQANYLLDQQLRALEKDFLKEGGFTERLYQKRKESRGF